MSPFQVTQRTIPHQATSSLIVGPWCATSGFRKTRRNRLGTCLAVARLGERVCSKFVDHSACQARLRPTLTCDFDLKTICSDLLSLRVTKKMRGPRTCRAAHAHARAVKVRTYPITPMLGRCKDSRARTCLACMLRVTEHAIMPALVSTVAAPPPRFARCAHTNTLPRGKGCPASVRKLWACARGLTALSCVGHCHAAWHGEADSASEPVLCTHMNCLSCSGSMGAGRARAKNKRICMCMLACNVLRHANAAYPRPCKR